jgi:hypothetical protein
MMSVRPVHLVRWGWPPTPTLLRNFDATQYTEPERVAVAQLAMRAVGGSGRWQPEQIRPGADVARAANNNVHRPYLRSSERSTLCHSGLTDSVRSLRLNALLDSDWVDASRHGPQNYPVLTRKLMPRPLTGRRILSTLRGSTPAGGGDRARRNLRVSPNRRTARDNTIASCRASRALASALFVCGM